MKSNLFSMSCTFTAFTALCFFIFINLSDSVISDVHYSETFVHRRILSDGKQNPVNHTHNATPGTKVIPNSLREDESMAGAEAAVLIIVVIVVLSVIGMVVYFMRKFDQLNKALPTYRYSSLKTEINGVYGIDDKTESQVLVSVSTEEEEDYDDEDEDDYIAPPTLLVRSQTVIPSKAANGSIQMHDNSISSADTAKKNEQASMDSDDELLQ